MNVVILMHSPDNTLKTLWVCDHETMSEIYAIWFGGHARKFEIFWIFELACGPGSRKFENQKFTDDCEHLPIFAKICRFLRKCCTFLRKYAGFCENMTIFSKI